MQRTSRQLMGKFLSYYKGQVGLFVADIACSLAVAGMLVMGGAAAAGAAIQHTSGVQDYPGENISYTASGDAITADGTDTRNNPQINIGNSDTQSIAINAGGGIFSLKSGHIP